LLAIGCGKKKEEPGAATGTASGTGDGGSAVTADADAPAVDAAPAPDVDAAAAAPASGLSGRADGVGPLDEKFAVTMKALEGAFPGFVVKRVVKSHGGDLKESYWNIQKDGKDLLHVWAEDGDIEAIDIMSDDVANPLGVKIGASYADVEKALGKLECANAGDEIDWRSDIVVCTSAKADTYTIDFVSTEGDDASMMMRNPEALATAKVRAVTWRAPVPGPG
jgi:hypothetical protein